MVLRLEFQPTAYPEVRFIWEGSQCCRSIIRGFHLGLLPDVLVGWRSGFLCL